MENKPQSPEEPGSLLPVPGAGNRKVPEKPTRLDINRKKESGSGKRMLNLVVFVLVLLIVAGRFLFPDWYDTKDSFLAFVSSLVTVALWLVDVIGGYVERKEDENHPVSTVIRRRRAKLDQAVRYSLRVSMAVLLIGIFIFAASLVNKPTIGKPVTNDNILNNYNLMYMGDINDIQVSKKPGGIEFIYTTNGQGPHQWEYKYIDGKLNPYPAKFAGIMLADGDGGNTASDGYDLRGYKEINWKACFEEGSDVNSDGDVIVEFVAGGITWRINDSLMKTEPVPFPDTLPHQSLGTYTLKKCPDAQTYSFPLSNLNLKKVIGGFGWVVSWAPNGVVTSMDGVTPEKVKSIKIFISDDRYVKDDSFSSFLVENLELLLGALYILILIGIYIYVFTKTR